MFEDALVVGKNSVTVCTFIFLVKMPRLKIFIFYL